MKRGTTNPLVRELIVLLERGKKPIWKTIAKELKTSTRKRKSVSLWKINRYTKANDAVVVPRKVLGNGELDHKVTVAALGFSDSAKEKLGADAITIEELVKKNPKGTGIKILK